MHKRYLGLRVSGQKFVRGTCHPSLTYMPAFIQQALECQLISGAKCMGASSICCIAQGARRTSCCRLTVCPVTQPPSAPVRWPVWGVWGHLSHSLPRLSLWHAQRPVNEPSLTCSHTASSQGSQCESGPFPWLPVLTCLSPC